MKANDPEDTIRALLPRLLSLEIVRHTLWLISKAVEADQDMVGESE